MKILSVIMLFVLVLTGCSNIFSPVSNKETDEARYEDAMKAIDNQDYATAVTKLESLPTSYQGQTSFKETLAGAYAGKCGLNFIDYFVALGSADLTGSTFFKFFMNGFTQKVVSPDDCRKAQLKMQEISDDPLLRTDSQNLFMAVLGMVKVGTYLRADADRDGTGSLGDGLADIPPLDICDATETASTADGWFSDDEMDEIITGTGLVFTNAAALGSASSANLTTALTDLGTICAGSCTKTKKADVTPADRDNFRDLLRTSPTNPVAPMGIGNCNNMDPTTCC